MQHLSYYQIYTSACTLLAYLRDCLTYMRQVTTHIMDYVDPAMTNILSSDKLPVEELRTMLRHIKVQLPSIMLLPISSDNALCFYWYLKTHMLATDGQFLLFIDIPIQDRAQQLHVYEIFHLPVPYGDVSVKYKISNKYIELHMKKHNRVMITKQQYSTCLHANVQFCEMDAPFQLSQTHQHV